SWMAGMFLMSGAMHMVGLFGAPRRTSFSDYFGSETAAGWSPYLIVLAVGATVLILSVLLMTYIVFQLMFKAPQGESEFPVAEEEVDAAPTPKWTERWSIWVVLMIAVISMGYVIPIVDIILNAPPGSPPFKTW